MNSNQHAHESRPADPEGVRQSGKTAPEQSNADPQQRQPDDDDDDVRAARLAADVLLGAKRIAEHLTAILREPIDESDVYYANRMKKLPIGKYGAQLIASKDQLGRHIEHIARGPAA